MQWAARTFFIGLPVALLVALLAVFYAKGSFATDTLTYLAAGERLNAGHSLYALSPGDRPVYLLPPFWTVPLVSPPTIAVLWRPLAALPAEAGLWTWWIGNGLAWALAVWMLMRRMPILTAGVMYLLLLPTGYELAVGNLNGYLLLGLVVTWRDWAGGRDRSAGVITAVMAAVKLTPAIAIWWLLVSGRRQAFAAALVCGVVALGVSLAGAGVGSHVEYLRVLGNRSAIGVYPGSLAGFAAGLGIPEDIARLAPIAAAGLGLVLVWLLRGRPAFAFAVVILTMILGSPAVNINWLVLLYALLAPLAWRAPARVDALVPGSSGSGPVPPVARVGDEAPLVPG